MSFRKILIPIDGSEYSNAALEKGAELAKALGAEVTLFYVMDRAVYVQSMVGTNPSDIDKVLEIEKGHITEDSMAIMERNGVGCSMLVADGIPAKKIIEISDGYDLIIMGTAGKTGLKKMILGSVTEQVSVSAKCPVMSVKIQE